jgi:hypothetical protein
LFIYKFAYSILYTTAAAERVLKEFEALDPQEQLVVRNHVLSVTQERQLQANERFRGSSKGKDLVGKLTEVEYIAMEEEGEDFARQRMMDLRAFPIQWIHSDNAICSAAAKLKATHRISFADS